jgi:hypothetical protein
MLAIKDKRPPQPRAMKRPAANTSGGSSETWSVKARPGGRCMKRPASTETLNLTTETLEEHNTRLEEQNDQVNQLLLEWILVLDQTHHNQEYQLLLQGLTIL